MNAEILTIAVRDYSGSLATAKAKEYPFPILYEKDGAVARSYDVYRADAAEARPSVFIIDSNGSLVWKDTGSTYHRTPNSDILAQLEKLS